MADFEIPRHVQEYGKDIELKDLRYHRHRVLVSKEFTFDAAHHLHQYDGKCKNLHGHTYKTIVGISGFCNPIGLTIDFAEVKRIWKEHIEPRLDHKYLNESLPPMNTSSENMVVWIYNQFQSHVEESPDYENLQLRVEFVRLYETPTSYAEARREWM